MLRPSLEEFRRLAERGNLVPVVAEIVSDVETPVGAFQKIGRDGFSFLFESAERNEESGRFSFIGIDPLLIVSQRNGELTIRQKNGSASKYSTSDPLADLQKFWLNSALFLAADIPHFQGGVVGFVGYDVIRFLNQSDDSFARRSEAAGNAVHDRIGATCFRSSLSHHARHRICRYSKRKGRR